MDKNKVYEVVFNTIKDSLDWSDNFEEKDGYSNYVEGVIYLAENLLYEIEKKNNEMGKCDLEDK